MNEWKEVRLGDVCENVSRRFNFKNKSKVIFINTGDILNGNFLHFDYSDKETLPGQAKKAIVKDDILFSEIRPKNKRFAYINFDNTSNFVVSTKFMVLKSNKKLIYPKYLYLLITSSEYLNIFQKIAESRSGTFPQITFTSISNVKIKLPPLPIQKKIADILSVIDEKIETLQNINETLEEMAKAIFKSWFVDFEIVKAKANGKSDSEIAKEFGISEEIVKLFPSEFVDSEIGKIPKGWEVVYLKDEFKFERGVEPGSKWYIENPTNFEIQKKHLVPFYRVKDLDTTANIYIPIEVSKNKISKFGDVLVSFDGTIGRVNAFLEGAYSSGIRKINASKYSNAFVYFLMKSDYIQDLIRKYATGTTILHASKSINYLYLIKNDEIIKEYEKVIIPIFKTILSNTQQIQTLQELRDTLLPKLINGEIEVDKLNIKGIEDVFN